MSAMRMTERSWALNEQEEIWIRMARRTNGYHLFKADAGRFIEARRVTRPICIVQDNDFVDYEILAA